MVAAMVELPADASLWHIGPHKTGTTAIQGVLRDTREQMARHGVLYPGPGPNHHREARVLVRSAAGWARDKEALPPERRWNRLIAEVRAHPGRSVVSSEIFGLAEPEHRARVAEEVGADRLHVLVAARNPGSIALSTWQQVLRDGKSTSLDAWLEGHFRRPEPRVAEKGFWRWADAATQVAAWAAVVPIDQIHVVAIDEGDRALLPTAFEQLLGLPAGLLANTPATSSNRGLTAAECELLQTSISLSRSGLTWPQFSLFYRAGIALRLVDHREPPADEPRLGLPEWARTQAAAEAEATIERLRTSGVHVIGDLDSLHRGPAHDPVEPTGVVPVELAAEAIAGLITSSRDRITALELELEQLRETSRTAEELSGRELARRLAGRVRARTTRRGRR